MENEFIGIELNSLSKYHRKTMLVDIWTDALAKMTNYRIVFSEQMKNYEPLYTFKILESNF